MTNNCAFATFDLSGILCVNQSQKIKYNQAWNDYNRIQSYNSNVSTLHFDGANSILYYTFISYAERESFRTGQYLHVQVYPNSNWNTVQED